MLSKYRNYIISVLIAFGAGALGGLVTFMGMEGYESVSKPALTPPPVVFSIVWPILFLLMGIGAALIFKSKSPKRSNALFIYAVQLGMDFIWCVLFFGFGLYLASFIWLVLLWFAVLLMIISFFNINKAAGLIQIPYLIWLTFAAYLNLMIWILN